MADRDDDDDDDLIERNHQSPPAKRIKWSKWHVLSSFFSSTSFFSSCSMTWWRIEQKKRSERKLNSRTGCGSLCSSSSNLFWCARTRVRHRTDIDFCSSLYPVTSLTRRFRQVFFSLHLRRSCRHRNRRKKRRTFLLIRFTRNKCEAVGDFLLIFISHQKTSVMKTKSRRTRGKKENLSSFVELLTNEKISRLFLSIR